MKLVGIENPEERYRLFPHHFSGGMLQRAAIAVALSSRPRILFADEPTTSLDATIQTQILDLLRQMQKNFGTSTILVTHDLGAAARAADRIAVMYAGKIAEIGNSRGDLLRSPPPVYLGADAFHSFIFRRPGRTV